VIQEYLRRNSEDLDRASTQLLMTKDSNEDQVSPPPPPHTHTHTHKSYRYYLSPTSMATFVSSLSRVLFCILLVALNACSPSLKHLPHAFTPHYALLQHGAMNFRGTVSKRLLCGVPRVPLWAT